MDMQNQEYTEDDIKEIDGRHYCRICKQWLGKRPKLCANPDEMPYECPINYMDTSDHYNELDFK